MEAIRQNIIPRLKKLYNSEYREFQKELRQHLERITNGQETEAFFDLISYFKAEFIIASYFYIDHINYFLGRLLKQEDPNILLPNIIFISSIGDSLTKDILTEYLELIGKHNTILKDAIVSLEKALLSIEGGIESLTFYPVMDIEDAWE